MKICFKLILICLALNNCRSGHSFNEKEVASDPIQSNQSQAASLGSEGLKVESIDDKTKLYTIDFPKLNQFKSSEVKGKDLGDGTGISYLDMKTTPGCLFFGPALELTGPAKISAKIIMSHRAFLNRDGSGKDQTAFVFDMISDDGRTKIKKWDLTPNMASYTCTAGHHEGSGNSRNFVMPYCDLKGDTTTAEQKKGFPYGDKLAVIAYTLEADLRVPVTDFEIRACNFSKLSTITAVKRIELTVTAN